MTFKAPHLSPGVLLRILWATSKKCLLLYHKCKWRLSVFIQVIHLHEVKGMPPWMFDLSLKGCCISLSVLQITFGGPDHEGSSCRQGKLWGRGKASAAQESEVYPSGYQQCMKVELKDKCSENRSYLSRICKMGDKFTHCRNIQKGLK